MTELQSTTDCARIDDPYERVFALSILQAFPHLRVEHNVTITACSGKRPRTTKPDFLLTNSKNQRLYIEIASGDKMTGRKSKQHKTASLAGCGSYHVTFYGHEVEKLASSELDQLRSQFLQLLCQRFNLRGFDFEKRE